MWELSSHGELFFCTPVKSWRGAMRMAVVARTICAVLLPLCIFSIWYSVAADYGYGAVSGTYTFRQHGEESTLVLGKDRTFQQDLRRNGIVQHAEGTWRRLGEGGMVFSSEFLKLSGQESRPDGQADGEVRKHFLGLLVSIDLAPESKGLKFKKMLFR
jgi:hypothetical protein